MIQKETQDHGVTTKEAISVNEFAHRLDGEGPKDVAKYDSNDSPMISEETAVTSKD